MGWIDPSLEKKSVSPIERRRDGPAWARAGGAMNEFAYENTRRVCYGEDDEFGAATFVPVCEKCSRFVKADSGMTFRRGKANEIAEKPNATCRKCGRTRMLFEGFL